MELTIYHYVLHYSILMVHLTLIQRYGIEIQSLHPDISQIIERLHMPTRSVMESVLVLKSREFAYKADFIPLVESFLIYLVKQSRTNRSNENKY